MKISDYDCSLHTLYLQENPPALRRLPLQHSQILERDTPVNRSASLPDENSDSTTFSSVNCSTNFSFALAIFAQYVCERFLPVINLLLRSRTSELKLSKRADSLFRLRVSSESGGRLNCA